MSLDTTGTSDSNSGYRNIYNYGYISGYIYIAVGESGTTHITNYGEMGGVKQNGSGKPIVIDNYGIINLINNGTKAHFSGINLTIKNYAINISSGASAFNAFSGTTQADNSHLILNGGGSVKFADKNAKVILDFGSGFELGSAYSLSKLIVDTSGKSQLSVDLLHLTTRTSIYKLTQSGDSFIVSIDAPNSEIGILHKSNVRTMNNFYTLSNSMIYPRKSQNLGKKNLSFIYSAIPLKSYESFAYRNESVNRRIQRQNKRNYNRKSQNQPQNLKENQSTSQTQTFSQNLAQNIKDYYFILTPFFNYNSFTQSGNYNLSGFDYGFLTAFSARVAESNSLGAHFIFSYGSLGDKQDKDLSIKSLNLNLGINYKLDLIYDMYLKARGDFFYFLNQVKTLTMFEAIKPNNLGFGVSVAYGKDFDFKQGGVLGIEVGLDYKALQSSTISLQNNATKTISETYQKALYNLIYVDLGLNYAKYFNSSVGLWGINATLGIKGNITANKLAKSQIRINNLNRSVDMVLDNDKILGYANIAGSYVLNHKNFDMEFSLAYYGNYGDKGISNGGGVEWRVGW